MLKPLAPFVYPDFAQELAPSSVAGNTKYNNRQPNLTLAVRP
jgi:hypothetical protein